MSLRRDIHICITIVTDMAFLQRDCSIVLNDNPRDSGGFCKRTLCESESRFFSFDNDSTRCIFGDFALFTDALRLVVSPDRGLCLECVKAASEIDASSVNILSDFVLLEFAVLEVGCSEFANDCTLIV